jgi:hypothetical protein
MTEGTVRVAPWSTVSIGILDGGSILVRTDCEEVEFDVEQARRFVGSMNSMFGPGELTLRKTGRVDPTPPWTWVERANGDKGWIGRDPRNPSRSINQLPYRVRTNSAVLSARG